ncbi:hypothetical protein IJ531_03645 [bacterium]|nr:hypothetical protein [bacterium]
MKKILFLAIFLTIPVFAFEFSDAAGSSLDIGTGSGYGSFGSHYQTVIDRQLGSQASQIMGRINGFQPNINDFQKVEFVKTVNEVSKDTVVNDRNYNFKPSSQTIVKRELGSDAAEVAKKVNQDFQNIQNDNIKFNSSDVNKIQTRTLDYSKL